MKRLLKILVGGVTGVGLLDGLGAVLGDGLGAVLAPQADRRPAAPFATVRDAWAQDALALRGDWQRVGDDLRSAMVAVSREAAGV